jgi:hypothetical protein
MQTAQESLRRFCWHAHAELKLGNALKAAIALT